MIRRIIKTVISAGGLLVTALFAILLYRAFDARKLPDLEPWHQISMQEEYRAGKSKLDGYEDYLVLEQRVFDELERRVHGLVATAGRSTLNRFEPSTPAFPGAQPRNWNRSYQLAPEGPAGGILLLHGLTDSPYSMRALAEAFQKFGLFVLVPRMPGHGTTPASLKTARWQDWLQVVRLAMAEVRAKIGPDKPLYLGGYSNGATLAVKYALDALDTNELEAPDRMFLFSPMIGVTTLARFASWHRVLSRFKYFEKFSWLHVYPEYDPFKYNSFPKMAGHQSYLIAMLVQEDLLSHAEDGTLEEFPPTIVFQSLVDSTVLTSSVIDNLLRRLNNPVNELVLFDINRSNRVDSLLKDQYRKELAYLDYRNQGFALAVVTNKNPGTAEVVARNWDADGNWLHDNDTGMSWPEQMYSLSHVAVPFHPGDRLYGASGQRDAAGALPLGALYPRGEKNILSMPVTNLMRLRYNPFFAYLEQRVVGFCAVCNRAGNLSKFKALGHTDPELD